MVRSEAERSDELLSVFLLNLTDFSSSQVTLSIYAQNFSVTSSNKCWHGFILPDTEVINGISLSSASPEDRRTVSRRASGGWMDDMSPQQQQESLSRGGGQQENRRVRHFSLCSSTDNRLLLDCFKLSWKRGWCANLLISSGLSNFRLFVRKRGSLQTMRLITLFTAWNKKGAYCPLMHEWVRCQRGPVGWEVSSEFKAFTRVTPCRHKDRQTTEEAPGVCRSIPAVRDERDRDLSWTGWKPAFGNSKWLKTAVIKAPVKYLQTNWLQTLPAPGKRRLSGRKGNYGWLIVNNSIIDLRIWACSFCLCSQCGNILFKPPPPWQLFIICMIHKCWKCNEGHMWRVSKCFIWANSECLAT